MAVKHYRDLTTWQKAMDLAVEIYRISSKFPADERFGLTNQIRRAAVSIPSNIAEGQGRGAGSEFLYHLRVSNGSRQEVETQLLLADRLGFISPPACLPILDHIAELGRLHSGLYRSIEEMVNPS